MTEEITNYQNNQELSPTAPMPSVNANVLEQLQAQAQSWGAAAQIAEQLARTDFAGPFKGKPADMAAAILKGATLGIPPADIGKSIYVVHGTPSLYGKTALAIALQNGYIAETTEDTPQAVTVRMTSPKGQEMEVRYTIERATKEGLVKGNKLQYETRPSKMLYWKCIGELTDRMIPHLTGGMPIKEDWEQSAPVKMRAQRMDVKGERGADAVRAALAAKKKQEPVVEDVLSKLLASVQQADTIDTLKQIMNPDGERTKLTPEEDQQILDAADARLADLTTEGAQ